MTSPMFRMVPPPPRVRADAYLSASPPVDKMDAAKIAKAVAALPQTHRSAVNWNYVRPVNPRKAAETIGCGLEELAQFVIDGRQMLINQGA
jgi:DNA-directed RNA polymerase specialized sigma24 family protein